LIISNLLTVKFFFVRSVTGLDDSQNRRFWQQKLNENLILVIKVTFVALSRISLEHPGAKLS